MHPEARMLIIVYLFVNCLLDNCRSSFNTIARTFTTTSAHNAVIMCVIGMWVKPRFRTQDDPCCHVRGWPWMWYTDLWTCGWVDKYQCQVSSPADSSFHNYHARRRRSKCRSCLLSSMMKSVGTNLQWNPCVPCITFLTHWRGRQMCVHPWTGRNWKITSTWYATRVYPQTNQLCTMKLCTVGSSCGFHLQTVQIDMWTVRYLVQDTKVNNHKHGTAVWSWSRIKILMMK